RWRVGSLAMRIAWFCRSAESDASTSPARLGAPAFSLETPGMDASITRRAGPVSRGPPASVRRLSPAGDSWRVRWPEGVRVRDALPPASPRYVALGLAVQTRSAARAHTQTSRRWRLG